MHYHSNNSNNNNNRAPLAVNPRAATLLSSLSPPADRAAVLRKAAPSPPAMTRPPVFSLAITAGAGGMMNWRVLLCKTAQPPKEAGGAPTLRLDLALVRNGHLAGLRGATARYLQSTFGLAAPPADADVTLTPCSSVGEVYRAAVSDGVAEALLGGATEGPAGGSAEEEGARWQWMMVSQVFHLAELVCKRRAMAQMGYSADAADMLMRSGTVFMQRPVDSYRLGAELRGFVEWGYEIRNHQCGFQATWRQKLAKTIADAAAWSSPPITPPASPPASPPAAAASSPCAELRAEDDEVYVVGCTAHRATPPKPPARRRAHGGDGDGDGDGDGAKTVLPALTWAQLTVAGEWNSGTLQAMVCAAALAAKHQQLKKVQASAMSVSMPPPPPLVRSSNYPSASSFLDAVITGGGDGQPWY